MSCHRHYPAARSRKLFERCCQDNSEWTLGAKFKLQWGEDAIVREPRQRRLTLRCSIVIVAKESVDIIDAVCIPVKYSPMKTAMAPSTGSDSFKHTLVDHMYSWLSFRVADLEKLTVLQSIPFISACVTRIHTFKLKQ